MDLSKIESIIGENGYTDFKWISGKEVVVRHWPRFKCMFGCSSYGKKGTCPPAVPSISECREFFNEYETIAVLHFQKRLDRPDDRHEWSKKINAKLLNLEKAVFLAGYHKTFLLFMDGCALCDECAAARTECEKPRLARPCPEGLGVDVFATVHSLGFPLEVLKGYEQPMNRYSFLMIG